MRIGILGAGAIGCVVGGLLTKGGHDVTLMDQWPEHVERLKREGLRLSGTCGDHVIPVKALHLHETESGRQLAHPEVQAVHLEVRLPVVAECTRVVDHLGAPRDEDTALTVGNRKPGFGTQRRLILHPDLVGALHHDLGMRGLIAVADFHVAQEIAARVAKLCRDNAEYQRIVEAGKAYVSANYSAQRIDALLKQACALGT